MKTRYVLFALAALTQSLLASAGCYLIYTPANELVWRATTPPVAMDRTALDAEVQKRVPGGHLVILNSGATHCTPLDLTMPRLTMRQKAAQMRGE